VTTNFPNTFTEGRFNRHHTSEPAMRLMNTAGDHYFTIPLLDLRLEVMREVWSPLIDWSGIFALRYFPELTGRKVLDIGSGCGIGTAAAICKGATRVVAIDSNPRARDNTLRNAEIAAIHSNRSDFTFKILSHIEDIDERFDFIYFNPPFHSDEPRSLLETAVSDHNYTWLTSVFHKIPHLTWAGSVVLGVFSESGNIRYFEFLATLAQLRIIGVEARMKDGYRCSFYSMVSAARAPSSTTSGCASPAAASSMNA
jgi:methylase of polypeptide subunit release factors